MRAIRPPTPAIPVYGDDSPAKSRSWQPSGKDCRLHSAGAAHVEDDMAGSRSKSAPTTKPAKLHSSNRKAKKTRAKRSKGDCFVIIPFGGWLDDYYDEIYVPAIEASGLQAHRADDLFRPSTIVNDIWAYTKNAKLLIADLSGKNPNVFYELGLAHALAKPAVLVAESIEDIPFDLRALRVIIYDKNAPDWGSLLKEKVKQSITEVLASPAEAVLPAFLNVRPASAKVSVTPGQKDVIEMKQELDLLRRDFRASVSVEDPRIRRDTIDPEEALSLIASSLNQGIPESQIIRRLLRLGPPPEWIRSEIRRLKKSARGGGKTGRLRHAP
jgi:hypothetical protein